MKMLKSLQKGISLLEVMLSLSIIAIILVMATRYFFTANNSQRVNESMQQINGLVGAFNAYRNANGNFNAGSGTDILTALVVGSYYPIQGAGCTPGTTPPSTATGCSLTNPWGFTVSLTDRAQGATVTFQTDSAATCTRLSTNISNSSCIAGTNGNDTLQVTVGQGGA